MKYLDDFLKYIDLEKKDSKYTTQNYKLDIEEYLGYCNSKSINFENITYKQARN